MGKVLRLHWIYSKVGGVLMTDFNTALNMISPVGEVGSNFFYLGKNCCSTTYFTLKQPQCPHMEVLGL